MQQLIRNKESKSCDVCAYQESGRVVFAYLCGYSCTEVQLLNTQDEDGVFSYSLIDYGKDEEFALKFIGEKASLSEFCSLTLADRLECIDVGQRLSRIFTGASVASAVYRNGGDAHIPFPLLMDYQDLVKVEYIHSMLQELMVNHEVNFLENEIAGSLYTLSNSYVWKSIDALSQRLVEEMYLGKNDIEECLQSTGLLPLFNRA